MRSPKTMSALEELGRTRLSESFFMRDFLYSEISAMTGIPNIPDDPELAVAAGKKLCQELLEPMQRRFGRIAVRSAYRSSAVNQHGNENGFNCSRNEVTYADHIWDVLDRQGRMGATACIIIPWFADAVTEGADWRALAWWIHDNLNYSSLYFFPRLTAFNIQWREEPERRIDSYIAPKGTLTKKGMPNW
ncbi:MAG: hypothetical protein QMD99_24855, partial [Rhizobiaceae bacterium]|nr:hypothetical protein [Rhizobiaceae bacterium]